MLYLGDFTWNQEFDLNCPVNRIGAVDLFVASRHGQPSSNSEALVHAIRPRVTFINNGTRKGGQPDAMKDAAQFSRPAGPVADPFFVAGRSGVHGPGNVHRQRVRRAAGAMPVAPMHAAAGRAGAAAASAQRAGALDQSVGTEGWHVHGDERPERFQQDVSRRCWDELTDCRWGVSPAKAGHYVYG